MAVLIKHAHLVRKTELEELMDGVEDVGAPVSQATHSEIVPAPPVALVVLLVIVMVRSDSKPGVPVHSARDRLLCGHPVHLLSVEVVPAAGVVHMRGDCSDILYDAGIEPGLELEVVGVGMALVTDLGSQLGMPPGAVHHKLSLMEGAAHRLFEVDVLALAHGEHRDREVGVVRNCSCNCFELISALVEHLAIVTESLGLGIHPEDLLALRSVDVHVAEGDHVDHAGLGEFADDLLTTVTYSDKGDLDLLATRFGLGQASDKTLFCQDFSRGQCHAGRCYRHGLQEISSVKHIIQCYCYDFEIIKPELNIAIRFRKCKF